ncbi:MAG: M1 family metallopeptidase [Clostridiales bacterium]|jgi:hypothetical protein|nr:M1 family metallopeptidase [Clostridiales bacterium]
MLRVKRFLLPFLIVGVFVAGWILNGCVDYKNEDKIVEYTISAQLNQDYTINAKQQVLYTNNSQNFLNYVKFNLYPNAFKKDAKHSPINEVDKDNAFVNGPSYGEITISNLKVGETSLPVILEGQDDNVLSVPVALEPTEQVMISFDFFLVLPNIRFRYGYTDKSINLGQWYPMVAVLQNGHFVTEPYFSLGDPFLLEVANYDIKLTTPPDYVLASSTSFERKLIYQQNEAVLQFAMKGLRLREFAICLSNQFKVASKQVDGVNLLYYYYQDEDFQKSLETATLALLTFNELYGLYPYNQLSVVQTTLINGGMEYAGLVMIADNLDRSAHLEVIVHEIAHQWWYAVVGNDQINHAWLDEGLAEYSTTIFFEKHTQFGISRKDRVAKAITTVCVFADSNGYGFGGKTIILDKPLNQFANGSEYVALVYAMGQTMFDSLRTFVGEKVFFDALRVFYKDNMFDLVTPDYLIGAFEYSANRDLQTFFDGWLYGNNYLFVTN